MDAPAVHETRSVCPYCGTGCGVVIEHRDGRITGVRGDPGHPANRGRLCSKGATLHQLGTTGRARYPHLRAVRGGEQVHTDWDTALETAAGRFAEIIRRDGPDAVAFYVSGQLLTEDYYVFNKLARALVGTNNIDSNSRLCMSSAVAGYKATLGADCVPACYEDIGLADHLLIAGSNTAWAHPIVFRRIEDAKRANPELFLTVVDPRRTESAACADLHLQLAPGSDLLLYNAMLHVLLWEDLIDREFIRDHTTGFSALRDALAEYSPGNVASACALAPERIVEAARRFGQARAALSLWCQGLNQSQHGTANNAALIHLHLATGQIGRPGAGPFSLTGQPNAMGGREVGAMATLLPGHRDPGDADARSELARAWGVAGLPARRGLTAVELFDALEQGRVKAVWIACTNPAHSLPDQARVRAALARAEFVVLQEAYADTETAAFADLLLPAAGWGEKSGTMTNSERRVARVRAAVPPPGEARADWAIAAGFALRLAARLQPDGAAGRGFVYEDEAAVFAEHVALTAGRSCDMSGLSHARLEREGPLQWPLPAAGGMGTARLFEDGRFAHADGRARFDATLVAAPQPLTAESPDARRPFVLVTGRLRDQWHGMSRSGKVARLRGHAPAPWVHLPPGEFERRGWVPGALVRVSNRRGEVVLPAIADDALGPGQAWLPMHWGSATLAQAGANALCSPACDPLSGQPALKAAAVAIAPFEGTWSGVWAVAVPEAEAAFALMVQLRAFLPAFDYAALTLSPHERPVLMLRLAAARAPAPATLDAIDAVCRLRPQEASVAFEDAARGIVKRARIESERLRAIRLVGEQAAFDWVIDTMAEEAPLGPLKAWLFAPLARAPGAAAPAGRIVCSCKGVSEASIVAAIRDGADLERLQATLACGTECGSCVPELRQILTRHSAMV